MSSLKFHSSSYLSFAFQLNLGCFLMDPLILSPALSSWCSGHSHGFHCCPCCFGYCLCDELIFAYLFTCHFLLCSCIHVICLWVCLFPLIHFCLDCLIWVYLICFSLPFWDCLLLKPWSVPCLDNTDLHLNVYL